MDPLAWQLAFGVCAVFIGIHMLTLFFEFMDYFTLCVLLNVAVVGGLTYGAVTYFLEIYLARPSSTSLACHSPTQRIPDISCLPGAVSVLSID